MGYSSPFTLKIETRQESELTILFYIFASVEYSKIIGQKIPKD